ASFEVSKFYLAYSQYCELERDYKESNRKKMNRFDCHGKLIIGVDIVAKEAKKSIISIAFHESDNNLIEIDKNDKALGPKSENILAKMDENDKVFDLEMTQICRQKVEAVRRMADHLKHELAANNFNHVIYVTNKMDRLFTMLNNIETMQNRRRYNLT
ncbi:24791_t:CDS:2, partial [Gigaspora rosea]